MKADELLTVNFARGDVSLSADNVVQLAGLRGAVRQTAAGAPLMPDLRRHVLLPPGEEAAGIEVLPAVPETIRLQAPIRPCPAPRTIGDLSEPDAPVAFDRVIYDSDEPYPGPLARLTGQGVMAGYRFASVAISPVQYLPARNVLLCYRSLTIRVVTRTSGKPAEWPSGFNPIFRRMAAKLAANPEALENYYTDPAGKAQRAPAKIRVQESDDPCDYLIVTSARLAPALVPLARWKTAKGVRARIVTVDSISALFPGADPAERVRSFIARAQRQWGITWVLLAGGIDDVPYRVAAGYPGDLYFSDLTGDWNLNRNDVWGEADDNVDLYPDVFVGRLPVGDTASAGNAVRKIIAYEQAPNADYQTKLLFIGGDLDNQTHTGQVKDSIEAQNVSAYPHLTVDKLYPYSPTVLNRGNVLAALDAGRNLVNFSDHADYYAMNTGGRTGGGQLSLSDASGLTNAGRPSVLYAIGCYNGAFDCGCIGGRFLTGSNGAAAFIGCSREAWYIPGQPCASASYRYDRQFFESLLSDSFYNLGAALGMAKAALIPSSGDGLMRWSQYEINLLGDPEMEIWTDSVRALAVTVPESLALGADTFSITAADSITGLPVAGSRVCLVNALDGAYATILTDTAGCARFTYDPNEAGTLSVTVSAHNHRPRILGIPVRPAPSHLTIAGVRIDDAAGNADGVPNPGETFTVSLLMRDNGTMPEDSIRVQLASEDTLIVPDSAAIINSFPLAPGDSVWIAADRPMTAAASCPDGRRIRFDAVFLAPPGLVDTLSIVVRADSLALEHYRLIEAVGDSDGQAEAGETIELADVRIGNYGEGRADSVSLRLSPLSPGVAMLVDSQRIGSIPPRMGALADGVFRFSLSAAGPYRFALSLCDRRGRQWADTFSLLRRTATPGTPTVATDRAGLKIRWDNSGDRMGFAVYRSPCDTSDYLEIEPLLVRDCPYYIDPVAQPGTRYSYAVAAADSSGCLSALSDTAGNSAPPGVADGWPRSFGPCDAWNWNAPVAGDINSDGRREVLMANPAGVLFAWNEDGQALAGWPRRFAPAINGPVAMADLDQDQAMEILVAHGDTLSAVKGDGSELAGWPYVADGTVSSPMVSDLDRNGRLDIVVACGSGQVRALNWSGGAVSEAWRWTLPTGSGPKLSAGDVRGNSLPEIVVTSWANSGSRGYILDSQGVLQDSVASTSAGDNNIAAPALLADLDGGGKQDIIAAYLSGAALCAWDGSGALLWRATPGMAWGTPVAIAAAGDSFPRIALSTLEGYACLLDRAGAAAPGWPVYWRSMHAAPVASDLDGDGSGDLLYRGDYGAITALSAGGRTLPGFPIATQDGSYSPVTLARLAPGGAADLLADTRAGEVYRWHWNAASLNLPDWPEQGHDPYRTNRFGALIDWCGRIGRSLTVSGDNFFSGDVEVDSASTVTVLPGARLYFSDRRDFENIGIDPQRAELIVRGRLVVNGTADDSVFCDTWSSAPCDSSWHGIRIEPGGSVVLNHCGIRHSLKGLYHAGIVSNGLLRIATTRARLFPNAPNPFVAYTVIRYDLPAAARVELAVYNVAGQRVRMLVGGMMPAGAHAVTWDGKDQNGTLAAAGVYLLRMEAGSYRDIRKAVLVR